MYNLYKKYMKYFDHDQKPMAASMQSISYCIKIINTFKLENILDLGSGVSTLLFLSKYKNVTSIDTDEKWAKKTTFIIKELLNQDLFIGNSIEVDRNQNFDFVYYDLGDLEERIYNFPRLLKLESKFIYLDDMHILSYRYYVESKIKDYKIVFLPETIDDFGRFGALLTKR